MDTPPSSGFRPSSVHAAGDPRRGRRLARADSPRHRGDRQRRCLCRAPRPCGRIRPGSGLRPCERARARRRARRSPRSTTRSDAERAHTSIHRSPHCSAAPLTPLSDTGLQIVGVLGSLAAIFGALWLLGVRDLRCYAAFALWPPTILAWQNANISVLIVLACALAWRFRNSWPRAGLALGIAIALKVLLWPLAVWFLATRRVWAAAIAVSVTTAGVLLSWAAIDFRGLASYPALLERLTEIETVNTPGVSIFSAALELGAPLQPRPRTRSGHGRASTRRLGPLRAQVAMTGRPSQSRSSPCSRSRPSSGCTI